MSSVMVSERSSGLDVDWAPALKAKMAPWMGRFLSQNSLAFELVERYGSPLHIVVASEFRRNVLDLSGAISQRGITGGLFFARKANKLPWFVSFANQEGIGVDTASRNELLESLELGVPPEKLSLTAIGKERSLIETAVSTGCLIVVDNFDELELVGAVAQWCGRKARVGLRFSGFRVNGDLVFSRFGFPVQDAAELLRTVAEKLPSITIELLHAHLDRYDVLQRAAAGRQLLSLVDIAAACGHSISAIDLGGGLLLRYLDDESQFEMFREQLIASVRGTRRSFTYQGDGLGYYRSGERVEGQADLYPAWNNLSKERFIAAVLDSSEGGEPLQRLIRERHLKLYFEPGRALLDNVGITLARVMFRKRDVLGSLLVGLSMNRTHLRPFRAEFCCDPVLLAEGERAPLTEGAFLVGNLCSESDLIYRRKLELPFMPLPNDLFCFVNTAGYLTHHLEVGTHGDPLPSNLLLDDRTLTVLEKD